jgi:hypothetical protein
MLWRDSRRSQAHRMTKYAEQLYTHCTIVHESEHELITMTRSSRNTQRKKIRSFSLPHLDHASSSLSSARTVRPAFSNSWRSLPSLCIAVMSSDPPIDSPYRITFGKVPRPVRRVSTALRKSPSSANQRRSTLSFCQEGRHHAPRRSTSMILGCGLRSYWARISFAILEYLMKQVNNTTSRGTRRTAPPTGNTSVNTKNDTKQVFLNYQGLFL